MPLAVLHLEAMEETKAEVACFSPVGCKSVWARRYAYARKGGWHLACGPVMGTTVTEARLQQRGYISFLSYYLKLKYRKRVE